MRRLDADEIARCFECVTEDPGPLDLDRLLAGTDSGAAAKATARNPEPGVQSVERSNSAAWRGEKGA